MLFCRIVYQDIYAAEFLQGPVYHFIAEVAVPDVAFDQQCLCAV